MVVALQYRQAEHGNRRYKHLYDYDQRIAYLVEAGMKSRLWYIGTGIIVGAAIVYSLGVIAPVTATKLDALPQPYYDVLFENSDVRVVEHKLNPGESEPMHAHPPMFVYFMEDAIVRITGPDGSNFEEELKKGNTLEVGGISHAIENLGSTPLHSILVELKRD